MKHTNRLYSVYKITCITEERCYIGYSISPERRRRRHFEELSAKRHSNSKLQSAYDTHGRENFSFQIIESGVSREDILLREEWWITHLDSCETGYNILSKGYNISTNIGRPVTSYDIKTKEIKNYDSIAEAARDIDISDSSNIATSITGSSKAHTCKGRIWCYTENFTDKWVADKIEQIKECRNLKYKNQRHPYSKVEGRTRPQAIVRNDGKIFNSMKDAAKELGLHQSNISRHLSGELKSLKGFTFSCLGAGETSNKSSFDPYWETWKNL